MTAELRTKLQLKVVPNASRTEIVGWFADALKVRVTAPANKGHANAAVEKLLAEALDLSHEAVRIVAGKSSPRKTIAIASLSKAEILARLALNET